MRDHQATMFADDLLLLESPRWHDGRLWVADILDHKVYTLAADGTRSVVCEVPHQPIGMGFLPDGTLVIASKKDRRLMKLVDGQLVLHADLSGYATGDLNDLVVDDLGNVYIGNFGYDIDGGEPKKSSDLHMAAPDGSVRVAASGVEFPNGMVITDGGRTLIGAETWASRLLAYDRAADGTLSNCRIYAELGNQQPDGICIDAAGGIWIAGYETGEVVRIRADGTITDRIRCGGRAIACALGGADGRTLFSVTYQGGGADLEASKRLATVLKTDVSPDQPKT
ncbi:SMP-30/gluconolactonase/LRE family protein [uncultured Sphingomonas sp.]|uniref:SMP-30/gluconolactonase/LRE family protein n=1 Tax=uncultured Sphingomonas sp. TaxID=158754 RepID=UPI0025FB69ED|nr:SMP-30/gluconolactonase/LRE family protein [uncultured Sphingomonas sp.]